MLPRWAATCIGAFPKLLIPLISAAVSFKSSSAISSWATWNYKEIQNKMIYSFANVGRNLPYFEAANKAEFPFWSVNFVSGLLINCCTSLISPAEKDITFILNRNRKECSLSKIFCTWLWIVQHNLERMHLCHREQKLTVNNFKFELVTFERQLYIQSKATLYNGNYWRDCRVYKITPTSIYLAMPQFSSELVHLSLVKEWILVNFRHTHTSWTQINSPHVPFLIASNSGFNGTSAFLAFTL